MILRERNRTRDLFLYDVPAPVLVLELNLDLRTWSFDIFLHSDVGEDVSQAEGFSQEESFEKQFLPVVP